MKNYIIKGLQDFEDAFGNNMKDCYESGNYGGGYEIEERDDGRFTLYGDSNSYFENFEDWSDLQKNASTRVEGTVLDIGCGAGKHSLYFQEKGLDVYAMDNSPLAIDICQKQGIKNTILCDVNHFEKFDEAIKFDSILFWGNNFGLLQNASFFYYFLNLLENLSHKGTKIFLESMDPFGLGFQETETVDYIQHNLLQKKMGGQMHLRVRYKKYVTPWSDYVFASIDELKEMLLNTNWVIEETLEAPSDNQYIAILKQQ
ncbi:MAG: class I SAM-dependent methyltransferase [Flavobacteriales bacterium]|nr:class I SAM-dependent methyltransferase [Flavobacteriales bacterium]